MFCGSMSDLTDRRRHGDAFPLNQILRGFVMWPLPVAFLNHGELIGQVMYSTNSPCMDMRIHLDLKFCPQLCRPLLLRAVAVRVCRSMQIHGECPEGLTPETALAEMRAARSSYDEVPSNLAAYDPSKLKILKSTMKPKYIKQFLPVEASKIFEHCESQVLKPDGHDAEPFSPYWDPSLKHNREVRLDFIDRLFKAGVLCFRPRARSFVGAFFCEKERSFSHPHGH